MEIKDITKKDIVYVDESGIDSRIYREYAGSKRGVKVLADITGKRFSRTTLIAGLVNKKIISPLRFEGYTDSKVFETYLEKCLIPELRKGQTVIIDNASFHKSKRVKELIEKANCRLIYLPPYSPDLNPIENSWAAIKAQVRKYRHKFQNLNQTIDFVFQGN